ncbi:hypothetical protein PTKIN_Ptkin12aG0185800 [Pterospermum kingtungense]
MAEPLQRYAVVTGANKGIGLEICKQLASKGITVVLTARDEKRGLEALQKLIDFGLSDHLLFHQLDVSDSASITSLADFVKNRFGKLDILVNNAGVRGGSNVNYDALKAASISGHEADLTIWSKVLTETYDVAEECLKTNYYGAKRTAGAFIPLLQLSDSPRIVNLSSTVGNLKYIPSEHLKGVFRDVDTEEKLDELLTEFLKDFKEGSLESKGWPTLFSGYTVSKAALNAHTRILAEKYPNFCVNCVCPGYVKTDLNFNTGKLTVEEGAETPVKLALLPNGGPSGLFFVEGEPASF